MVLHGEETAMLAEVIQGFFFGLGLWTAAWLIDALKGLLVRRQ
jgi:hypothetical protein